MKYILIYDAEIINCIPSKTEKIDHNLSYCRGWDDYLGMGISVVGTWRNYDLLKMGKICLTIPKPLGIHEAFVNENNVQNQHLGNNLDSFNYLQKIIYRADKIVGFNSTAFDDKLCQANGIDITTNYDLLSEIRIATNQPAKYVYGLTRKGYALKDLSRANLTINKTSTGELAPVLWQKGKKQEVIDYCLNDVKILKELYFLFIKGELYDPTNGRKLPYKKGSLIKIEVDSLGQKIIALYLGAEKANPRHYSNYYFFPLEKLEVWKKLTNNL
ncbi:hypothetical protein H6G11_07905 [Cyanobacterium aponinum FACHB-4101]|uniref:hypothetical protein n=1 Tax=Cyanobacterium aponinum TaxID=379064 RepID=UPI001680C7E9|nr:hypothetical protein [Cyanobacterium aponinum]MBD2394182.1 hypothetical protein [Cyanobacterium aponinum FACHB-4101]